MTYYVLQAASVAGQPCGSASYPSNPSNPSSPGAPSVPSVPQIIIPVEKVEPNADGNYVHIVKSGQSFWSIAVAYKVTGDQIRSWNNLPQSYILQPGDKLTSWSERTELRNTSPCQPDCSGHPGARRSRYSHGEGVSEPRDHLKSL